MAQSLGVICAPDVAERSLGELAASERSEYG
jgi:hypothetical protein